MDGLRIGVIGCGYLGATHAACMAELGFEVLGLDVVEEKVEALNAGDLPFFEPGLNELVLKGRESGQLRFTTSYDELAAFADVFFVCVSTPQRHGELAADLSKVDAVVESLAPLLDRPVLVVGKSTVPVGTAERLAQRFAKLAPAGELVHVAWNPEFLREGFGIEDTLRPDRLVFGLRDGADDFAEKTLSEVYRVAIDAGTPVVVTDFPTAELVKVSANAFLATKISFINAMAEVCEASGADVTRLADAIGHDARIGRRFLNAGLGFGGGCLPKDIRAFMARAGELGAGEAVSFLGQVDAINQRRRQRAVDLAREVVGRPWPGVRVAVLGAAFKPDSDDIRDSPALNVAGRLHLQGAHVTVYDPRAMKNAAREWPTLSYAESAHEACRDAHVVLLLTEWDEFVSLDPAALAEIVATPLLVDGRNALEPAEWRDAGWTYRAPGRN
ncbi:MAG TPA: UDP-glucose/GDP-mannose dehydrogenase family protein [Nocardioidaceae bacterium]|nr:UDP-glucose/GDP-mannose dehydrogenase family protein [Nocardioidaceae bacterium]